MRYIFFDIECANCFNGDGKICSFGYVITDRFFNVLEKEDIIINPKAPFMLGRKGKNYIKLAYTPEQFKRAKDFPAFYRKIKSLLTSKDALVFGYASENDANFLRSECERYILPCINFKSYDVQRMLRYEIGMKNMMSLSSAEAYFGVCCRQEIHKSDDDSLLTLEVLKNLCLKFRTSPEELIRKYPNCINELSDYSVLVYRREGNFIRKSILGDHSNLAEYGSDNFTCYQRFIYNVKGITRNNNLIGKRFFIYPGFVYKNYREAIKLVQLITDCGGQVTEKICECNFFIYNREYDEFGNMVIKPSLDKFPEYHSHPTFISPEEALSMIGLNYGEFLAIEAPDISYLIDDIYEVKVPTRKRPFKKRRRSRNRKNAKNTTGGSFNK